MIALEDLQKTWAEIDQKLDRNWKLNLEIIRQSNLDKAKSKVRRMIWTNAFTLAFYVLFTFLFITFTIHNFASLHLAATGIALAAWTLVISIAAVHELELISRIDYAAPIPQLQKQLSHLRLVIIKYLRIIVWIFPLNFAFIILFFYFLGVDIVAIADQSWIIGNLIFSLVVFVPFSLWATIKLNPKNAEKKWMNSLLGGNGSHISSALALIGEIEDFERDQQG